MPSDSVLYTSAAYSLFSNRVVQGKNEAVAISPTHLRSTYQSPANQTFNRLIEFKFSLNGKDNELPVGVNHHLVLQPVNGKVVTPIIVFGQQDAITPTAKANDFLEPNTEVTIKLDMRQVLEAFQKQGYYTSSNGDKLYTQDFKGVFVAGGSEPLSWDFENLPSRQHLQLTDPDKDGIYTVTLTFNAYNPENFTASEWKLNKDISRLPQFSSSHVLLDALYNMSLEESMLDIRPDQTFMAGAKWDGVWTRDISYSIVLALAAIHPEISKNSLLRKVKDGRIIQDTGTGGSWPISSDRMTWALAAWEVYVVTGDQNWLQQAFAIIKKSAEEDLLTVQDPKTGLMRGESSFLDWRKQTYPLWMQPVDIYESLNLGTNAVHYQTYRILEQMAQRLGQPSQQYSQLANLIKQGINEKLWSEEHKYYGQYLYGRLHVSLSPKAEALGEALTILYGIADGERQTQVLNNTPQTNYGIPSIYPYIPEIPPYHNNSMWPFVQAYWTWAAAEAGHTAKVSESMSALYRAAALFLTNKENLVATTGDYKGTEINSDRQLWSVAGNLAMVYRVFFGMKFEQDKLVFKPVVPANFAGKKTLTNFPFRKAVLNIKLEGHGTQLKEVYLDGKRLENAEVPASLTGQHTLRMILAGDLGTTSPSKMVEHLFSPTTPQITYKNGVVSWPSVSQAASYKVLYNGKESETKNTTFAIVTGNQIIPTELQVKAVDKNGTESFLSEPLRIDRSIVVELETTISSKAHNAAGFTGKGYTEIKKGQAPFMFKVQVNENGYYALDFRYANGSGPINTDNKASIRSLAVNGKRIGAMVFPQRGFDEWSNWGYSNAQQLYLPKGIHTFTLSLEASDENMNGDVNEALLDHLRLTWLRAKK
ncbi:glycogen debranching protein [Nibribacter koreensis]|uniref:CBM6 domain-containing protein n=1 Tax=Nibribacter koreensis TaxID=1084519 RepID=A0ABP8FBV7_9BACT